MAYSVRTKLRSHDTRSKSVRGTVKEAGATQVYPFERKGQTPVLPPLRPPLHQPPSSISSVRNYPITTERILELARFIAQQEGTIPMAPIVWHSYKRAVKLREKYVKQYAKDELSDQTDNNGHAHFIWVLKKCAEALNTSVKVSPVTRNAASFAEPKTDDAPVALVTLLEKLGLERMLIGSQVNTLRATKTKIPWQIFRSNGLRPTRNQGDEAELP